MLFDCRESSLETERTRSQSLVASLRLGNDTAELDLKGFMNEEEELRHTTAKLQRYLDDHTRVMGDARRPRRRRLLAILMLSHLLLSRQPSHSGAKASLY